MKPVLLACALLLLSCHYLARAQNPGETLPPWRPGVLDIHRISTGKGDAVFYIFPDRTTLLVDPAATLAKGPRFTEQRPNASRSPGEWVARYVSQLLAELTGVGLGAMFFAAA